MPKAVNAAVNSFSVTSVKIIPGPVAAVAATVCILPKLREKRPLLIMELIKSLLEHFKMEHLAGILAGQVNAFIKSYKHDESPFFGKGKDKDMSLRRNASGADWPFARQRNRKLRPHLHYRKGEEFFKKPGE